MAEPPIYLKSVGRNILKLRLGQGLSQIGLARRCGLSQTQISYFEVGHRQPTLVQLLAIASGLNVSTNHLLWGADRLGRGVRDLAVELRGLGIRDLWVKDEVVPGAFRRPEELLTLAVSAPHPDPRIVEAIPALLAWNPINSTLLIAFARITKTLSRIAWLADIALTIDRLSGFPGGCETTQLEAFVKWAFAHRTSVKQPVWDSLGKPAKENPTSPAWVRWHISYDSTLAEFSKRAQHLASLKTIPSRLTLRDRFENLSPERKKRLRDAVERARERAKTRKPRDPKRRSETQDQAESRRKSDPANDH